MLKNHYDAIVVGSGISGGWAAKELCKKGLKVLLLERGKNIEHIKGYEKATTPTWDLPLRGQLSTAQKNKMSLASLGYGVKEGNYDWWVTKNEHEYIEKKPFDWIRGYQVGGRSLLWGRQSYRLSDLDFEANIKEGIGVDWPIRYKDIARWYDYVERFAGISGSKENLSQLPDGKFLPPMEMNCVERDVADKINKTYKGTRRMIIGRSANITKPIHGRMNCQYRNKCNHGCPFGGYFSSQSSTLPAAFATGNLTLRPFSLVTHINYDKENKKATGVSVLDSETNLTYEFTSKIIFLCASTINSTSILMNSANDIWEGGLGSSSGELGHNLMDHQLNVGASGMFPGHEDKYYYGRRPNGIYIPRYKNLKGENKDFLRGYGYQGGGGRVGWQRNVAEINMGVELKETLSEPGIWTMGIVGFGEILPYYDNKITLNHQIRDKNGLPTIEVDSELKSNELIMRKIIGEDAAEMLDTSGVKNVNIFDGGYNMGKGIHEMGTARMGKNHKTSVLNQYNQVWDAKNVFVTDGACMTSSGVVNPSLTYMALTARACSYAVDQMKKLNL